MSSRSVLRVQRSGRADRVLGPLNPARWFEPSPGSGVGVRCVWLGVVALAGSGCWVRLGGCVVGRLRGLGSGVSGLGSSRSRARPAEPGPVVRAVARFGGWGPVCLAWGRGVGWFGVLGSARWLRCRAPPGVGVRCVWLGVEPIACSAEPGPVVRAVARFGGWGPVCLAWGRGVGWFGVLGSAWGLRCRAPPGSGATSWER